MIAIDLSGKAALITGGTRGIGLATGLELGRAGAQVYLTYKWGSADPKDIFRQFEEVGAPQPILLEADVSLDEDTHSLMEQIAQKHDRVDIFVSNVAFAQRTPSLEDYKKRSFFKTLEYSTWPMIAYTQAMHERFGAYPAHIIGISSDGHERFYPAYDFVAASKALLETFARYLSAQLQEHHTQVNVVRFGMVRTQSFEQMFGPEFLAYLEHEGITQADLLDPNECGRAILAICSGLMGALNGQIITVDRGQSFQDNLTSRFARWKTNRAPQT